MKMLILALFAAGALALARPATAQGPTDPDTAAWWAITGALSSDAMEGRDTGSVAYERAARLTAQRFAAAGLRPLGGAGGWLQSVPMEELAVTAASLSVGPAPLRFLHDWTVTPNPALPAQATYPLAYRGYCARAALGDVAGKLVVCHGTRRAGLTTPAAREAAVRAAGAAGMITIADPGFTVEPPRWPFAYARTVSLSGEGPRPDPFLRATLNADALGALLPGRDAAALVKAGSAGTPLPSFDGAAPARLGFTLTGRTLASSNVIGLLPGTNPALANQAIVVSAHLDGYGRGEPVDGDGLYNGTLDDAAYVALLVRLAERRQGKGFARPIIFLIITGEEKGLLGSKYWVAHPTRPLSTLAANINLDQLRPIFPLKLLTVHARTDSTLGDDATAIATAMGIRLQDDPEPERGLLGRSDQINFIQAGIPATAFVFGYEPGSPSEAVYRQWYRTGYHKPQDDLAQLMDWRAAADFNSFFYRLVERVAEQPQAPAWKPGSKLRPVGP